MKQKVQNSSTIVDNTKENEKRKSELIRSYKEKIQNDTNTYLLWKKDLDERMDQKPLLLESGLYLLYFCSNSTINILKVNKYMAGNANKQSRDFEQIAHLLEENNLEAFNEEEREIILEMANLKNQGFKLEDFHSS